MKRFAFWVVFSLLAIHVQVASAKAPVVERFALVVGNNRPLTSDGTTLHYADDDAVATHRLLLEAGVDSVLLTALDSDSQRLLRGARAPERPRREELERAYAGLVARMQSARERQSEVDFLFFYSGHGDVEAGEGFLVLENGKFTRSNLFALLLRSPAKRNHVFVDACKSYFVAFDRGPGGERDAYLGPDLVESVPGKLDNTGFVLSTSSDRDSHEWDHFQGGILSHELRSALRGAADTNLDARISYAEIGAFLHSANESIPVPRFRPDFLVRAPGGNLREAVLSWNGSHPSLSFRAGSWGHFYIENAYGDRLLDAHPAPQQALRLWPSDERPLFVRQHDGNAEYVVNPRESLQVSEFSPTTSTIATRGALSLAFDRLFELPFADTDVRRFEAKVAVDDATSVRIHRASNRRRVLQWSSGLMAIGAASAGVTFSALALVQYTRGADAPQTQLEEINGRVATFNRASLACYGTALVAGTIWGVSRFWPSTTISVAPSGNGSRAAGATLELGGRF